MEDTICKNERGITFPALFIQTKPFVNIKTINVTFCTNPCVFLTDDLEPAADDADYEIQKRFNSALRIRVFRTNLLEDSPKQGK